MSGSGSGTSAIGIASAAVGDERRRPTIRERIAWVVGGVSLAAVAVAVWQWPDAPPPAPVARFSIPLDVASTAINVAVALAPDGHAVAMQSNWESRDRRLHLRRLDSNDVLPLPGTEGGQTPFWSPDSASIGFFADGQLKRFDMATSSVRPIGPVADLVRSNSDVNLWAIDADRGTTTRMTLAPTSDTDPRWSLDGLSVIFASLRDPARSPYRVGLAADTPTRVWKFDGSIFALDDWSEDGRWLLYHDARVPVLHARELDTAGAAKTEPIVGARALTGIIDQAQMSPNGRWVAYHSNESGQNEVYVTPFPPTGARYTISRDGGVQPTWRGDSSELYFLAPDTMLKAVRVSVNGTTLVTSDPVDLFKPQLPGANAQLEQYLPHPSGQRFLSLDIVGNDRTLSLGVLMNWRTLLPVQR